MTSNLTMANRRQIMDFAYARRLPTLCEFKEMVQAGCLLSYGPTLSEFAQRAAAQIDKILKGASPGEIPVEQVTRFEMVVNFEDR